MKQNLKDFVLDFQKEPMYSDYTFAISLIKNPFLRSRAKHIDLRHQKLEITSRRRHEIEFVKHMTNLLIFHEAF